LYQEEFVTLSVDPAEDIPSRMIKNYSSKTLLLMTRIMALWLGFRSEFNGFLFSESSTHLAKFYGFVSTTTLFFIALLPRKLYRLKILRRTIVFLCGLTMLMSMLVMSITDAYSIYDRGQYVVSFIIHCLGFFVLFLMACEAITYETQLGE